MGKSIQIYMDDELNKNLTLKCLNPPISKQNMILKILEAYFKEEVLDEG